MTLSIETEIINKALLGSSSSNVVTNGTPIVRGKMFKSHSPVDSFAKDNSFKQWFTIGILALVMVMAFSIRLYSVVRFESVIHEFDPWFNYRATQYLVEHGPRAFFNWFDNQVWYPMGRHVGKTVYPGMILVSGFIYYLLNTILAMPVELRNICVFLGPVTSALTSLSAYLVTKECFPIVSSNSGSITEVAGLFAAAFTAIVPGYISRSVAGSFDYEAIAICQMLTTFYVWLMALRRKSAVIGVVAALSYFFMAASWGGYVFIINVIPLHALSLCLLKPQYIKEIYKCYCSFYVIALLSAMTVPFVSHQPIDTSEHMLAMGTFALMQILLFVQQISDLKLSKQSQRSLLTLGTLSATMVGIIGVLATGGKVVPWAGRFYSLWDTSYARKHIPIIASVSEHQPTTWSTFFLDMQLLCILFPVGLFYILKNGWHSVDGAVFIGIYALSATYFASVMVRLILTLAPLVCVASGVAASKLVHSAFSNNSMVGGGISQYNRWLVSVPIFGIIGIFLWHCVYITHNAYSSPSIMLASYDQRNGKLQVIDDFREAYSWLRHNTPSDSKILSWWDYGYQLNGMANRTTIVDNNTWNNDHIALVGKILASPEEKAYQLCRQLDVNYVLILFGGLTGFSGDDLNKFLWMVRIAQGVFPEEVKEQDFFNSQGEFRVDDNGSVTLRNSLMYRLSYANLGELLGPQNIDRVRRQQVSKTMMTMPLKYFREVFSTENYLVRIYQVVY